jgi:hypothetical protein
MIDLKTIEDASRRDFEAWAVKQKDVNGLPYFIVKSGNGFYADDLTNHAWNGWQAARQSSQSEPVAEVYLDEYQMKQIRWNAHHWTHILSAGSKLYLAAPQQAIPAGYALVDISKLKQLQDSIKGNYYQGKEWEINTIEELLSASPTAPIDNVAEALEKAVDVVSANFAEHGENADLITIVKSIRTLIPDTQAKRGE